MQTPLPSSNLVLKPRETYVTANNRQVLIFEPVKVPWLFFLRKTVFRAMLNIEDGLWISCCYLPDGRLWSMLTKRVKSPEHNIKRHFSKPLQVVK